MRKHKAPEYRVLFTMLPVLESHFSLLKLQTCESYLHSSCQCLLWHNGVGCTTGTNSPSDEWSRSCVHLCMRNSPFRNDIQHSSCIVHITIKTFILPDPATISTHTEPFRAGLHSAPARKTMIKRKMITARKTPHKTPQNAETNMMLTSQLFDSWTSWKCKNTQREWFKLWKQLKKLRLRPSPKRLPVTALKCTTQVSGSVLQLL